MRKLLAVVAAALALPAAAQAKEITGLAVCGPDDCEHAKITGFGHRDPIGGVATAPPLSQFLRIDFYSDVDAAGFSLFYEPVSGLVATEGQFRRLVWARLAPPIAAAVEEAAARVEPFPAPRVTGARIGARRVTGDPSSYLSLLTVEGPSVAPKTASAGLPIVIETAEPNPWTVPGLLYYPDDDVLQRSGTLVKLPAWLAADIEAGRSLGGEGGAARVPWLPIAVALVGTAALVALFLRTRSGRRRALVVASVLALALPAGAAAKGPLPAEVCGADSCRAAVLHLRLDGAAAAPPPGPFYELRVEYTSGLYYEPRSGRVAHADSFGAVTWSRAPVRVEGLRPHPAPRVSAAWVGDRRVSGDPSGYLSLLTLRGPFVVPEHPADFVWIRLESPTPNPWTSQALVYYPRDRVLLVEGSRYVGVPGRIADALAAAKPLSGGRTVPWLPIATLLAGAAGLLLLRTLGTWSASWRPSSSSTSSGRPRWLPGRTRRSSAAA